MSVANTDTKYHSAKTPEKCLHEAERAKKKMYLEYLPQQRQQFSFFVASIDGLLGVEATVTLKMISRRLKKKWLQTYLRTWRYVKSRVAITLVQATHRCIQGPGCRRTKLVSSACNGKMAPGSTSSGKSSKRY